MGVSGVSIPSPSTYVHQELFFNVKFKTQKILGKPGKFSEIPGKILKISGKLLKISGKSSENLGNFLYFWYLTLKPQYLF
jgi:hypothetical protein